MKKIYCELDNDDFAKISVEDGLVNLSVAQGYDMNVIVLSPDKIRKLRKQLKKALEAIEGVGEETEEDSRFPDWFQPGAIVEITGNSNDHHFRIGEKVRVGEDEGDDGSAIRCDYLDGHDYWFIQPSDCKPA